MVGEGHDQLPVPEGGRERGLEDDDQRPHRLSLLDHGRG
jgi:hypothetical protein